MKVKIWVSLINPTLAFSVDSGEKVITAFENFTEVKGGFKLLFGLYIKNIYNTRDIFLEEELELDHYSLVFVLNKEPSLIRNPDFFNKQNDIIASARNLFSYSVREDANEILDIASEFIREQYNKYARQYYERDYSFYRQNRVKEWVNNIPLPSLKVEEVSESQIKGTTSSARR
jgi:hypothetical protein